MNEMTPMAPSQFATDETRWAAVRRRDPSADGSFVYAVATTGVFCRPSCAARPALRQHVTFYASIDAATAASFRPCKRCRPDLPPRAEREAALIARACRQIREADSPPALADLASAAGLSAAYFHRLFRAITGVTPRAYADAERQDRMRSGLTSGQPITAALYEAGFNSSGRFYEASSASLGMTPTRWRDGGPGEVIRAATAPCVLGLVLVAATDRGVCAILLGDDATQLTAELHRRFPKAHIADSDAGLDRALADIVAAVDRPGDTRHEALPLDIRGTAFQRRVWEALRTIPAGQTQTYGEVARRIGQPTAVRAVAAACGANPLAVVVPCHRVIGADGTLTGYRWGVERKRELLRREAEG